MKKFTECWVLKTALKYSVPTAASIWEEGITFVPSAGKASITFVQNAAKRLPLCGITARPAEKDKAGAHLRSLFRYGLNIFFN